MADNPSSLRIQSVYGRFGRSRPPGIQAVDSCYTARYIYHRKAQPHSTNHTKDVLMLLRSGRGKHRRVGHLAQFGSLSGSPFA